MKTAANSGMAFEFSETSNQALLKLDSFLKNI